MVPGFFKLFTTQLSLGELRCAPRRFETVLHKAPGLRPLDFTGFFEGLRKINP